MTTIMVQIAEKRWTSQAVHMASAIARHHGVAIHLVRMIPVQHASWLGTEFGNIRDSSQEYADFMDYCKTAEDYGVTVCLSQMQYHTLHEAIAEAAEYLNADLVFATLPDMRFRLWRKFLLRRLTRRLEKHQRTLFTLEPVPGADDWTPSVTLPSPKEEKEGLPQLH
jgi:hypothetical protein